MFYQEVRPGIFVSNEQKIHYKLAKCEFCNSVDTLSHHKYTDRCIECGNLYNLYTVRRTARRNRTLSSKATRAHMKLLEELEQRRVDGLRVPTTLDEELVETRKLIVALDKLDRAEEARRVYITVKCRCCDASTEVPSDSKPPFRCAVCSDMYARYRDLYTRVFSLDQCECDELATLIRTYLAEQKLGHHIPHVSRVIHKLNKHIVAIGGEHYKFYAKEEEDE